MNSGIKFDDKKGENRKAISASKNTQALEFLAMRHENKVMRCINRYENYIRW